MGPQLVGCHTSIASTLKSSAPARQGDPKVPQVPLEPCEQAGMRRWAKGTTKGCPQPIRLLRPHILPDWQHNAFASPPRNVSAQATHLQQIRVHMDGKVAQPAQRQAVGRGVLEEVVLHAHGRAPRPLQAVRLRGGRGG